MNVKDKAKQEYEENIQLMQGLKERLDAVENKKETTETRYPDATKHKYVSFIKSGFRILAGATLIFGEFTVAGMLLIVAELLGIVEEVV
jgi:hypothetical protein